MSNTSWTIPYDYHSSEYTNFFGDTIPSLTIDDENPLRPKSASSPSYINLAPTERLKTTLGLRYERFRIYRRTLHRVTAAFADFMLLLPKTNLTAAFGIYNQTVPMVLLSQQKGKSAI